MPPFIASGTMASMTRTILLIRMAQALLQWMLEHILERDEVIHCRARHEDVLFDDTWNGIPFWFIFMS